MSAEAPDPSVPGTDGADLLNLLLTTRDADTGEAMPQRQVRDEALTILLAGH